MHHHNSSKQTFLFLFHIRKHTKLHLVLLPCFKPSQPSLPKEPTPLSVEPKSIFLNFHIYTSCWSHKPHFFPGVYTKINLIDVLFLFVLFNFIKLRNPLLQLPCLMKWQIPSSASSNLWDTSTCLAKFFL